MYARKQFFISKHAIDRKNHPFRPHSDTQTPAQEGFIGREVWFSDVKLEDGRPMAIGMDTCLCHDLELPKVLSAFNLQTSEVICKSGHNGTRDIVLAPSTPSVCADSVASSLFTCELIALSIAVTWES